MKAPTMLVILDGFGYRQQIEGNAIAQAKMPFWNFLCSTYPSTLLNASGAAVGLLDGYMGNSEVGHLTLGAGRTVKSTLKKMHDDIDSKNFFSNPILSERLLALKQTGKALHIMGLVSDAGVHSHEYHLYAFIQLAAHIGIKTVYIHAFLDGRDTPPTSAAMYLQRLEAACEQRGCGIIASLHGRFYAMDRDKNLMRTKESYDCLTGHHVSGQSQSWSTVLEECYKNGQTDEFINPVLLVPSATIQQGDGIIFTNFRPDRAQQLTEAFINPLFSYFDNPYNTGVGTVSFFISPVRYNKDFAAFKNDILYQQELVEHTLLDEIAAQNKTHPQSVVIIAETEKYAHVTYFFRGMRDIQLNHETRILAPSIKTKSYANTPEMSAPIITQTILQSLHKHPASFYLANYANADMVGHSGDLSATIKACEVLDQQLAQLYAEVVEHRHGIMLITADHGNAEEKKDSTGAILTAHTCNPVPCVLASKKHARAREQIESTPQPPRFGLAHVAPTLLSLMQLSIPVVMEQEVIEFE